MAVPSSIARLGEEIVQLKAFVALLQREQELLARADTEALLPLVEQKTSLANALADYSQAREALFVQMGLPAGRTGMEAWLAANGNDSLRSAWQDLLALAADARALNVANGKLISLHMQKNQQAFTALMSATNRAMTYGPDGQQQAGLGGRILGTA